MIKFTGIFIPIKSNGNREIESERMLNDKDPDLLDVTEYVWSSYLPVRIVKSTFGKNYKKKQ